MDAQKFSGFDESAIADVLEYHSGEEMSARDIVEFLYEQNPEHFDKLRKKRRKTYAHMNDFIMQLAAELHGKIGSSSKVIARKYGSRVYYKIIEENFAPLQVDQKYNQTQKTERVREDKEEYLYPIICKYLRESHKVFSMRIDERRSPKGNTGVQNLHLFPDIVGMEENSSLEENLNDDIKAISRMALGKKIGIWSVEVKVEVNHKSVRRDLSQTLNNSSWANRAYLAAARFSAEQDGMPDEHIERELSEYANDHGIGVIKIDKDDYLESKVLIKAKERKINWNGVNKLARNSNDFMKFIRIYRRYYESNTGDKDWKDMIRFLSDSDVSDEDS